MRQPQDISEDDTTAQARAALDFSAKGKHAAALRAAVSALASREDFASRSAFVTCVRAIQFFEDNAMVRGLILRALQENWGRPEDLALPAADLVKAAGTGFASLAQDELLHVLLCVTPNQDAALETLLTEARAHLLRKPDGAHLRFHCALARQCFLNEYVFAVTEEEEALAERLAGNLAAALDRGLAIAPSQVAALACYRVLDDARLLTRRWPAGVAALLTQQILEPQEEAVLAGALPQLTAMAAQTSQRVARQYEENPYPRWVMAGPQPPRSAGESEIADILVAGCGTGRNALETARSFPAARLLAVDLSRASLAHSARKAREAGCGNIEHAQADILEMGAVERRFDLIEAVGVLHHLEDPFAGWRILLGLLNPGGVMKLGLYSGSARSGLARARAELAANGFDASPQNIRRARSYLRSRPEHAEVTQRPDFFALSNCRDLLFHVQESHVSLAMIAAFLRVHGLSMLGFDLDWSVLEDYRRRFPDDPRTINLDNWAQLEAVTPSLFDGMYQFWIQAPSS